MPDASAARPCASQRMHSGFQGWLRRCVNGKEGHSLCAHQLAAWVAVNRPHYWGSCCLCCKLPSWPATPCPITLTELLIEEMDQNVLMIAPRRQVSAP